MFGMRRKLMHKFIVFLVFAGKGGTGKSTVASNLACRLSRHLQAEGKGRRVGLLDADLETPSVAYLFGLQDLKHTRNPDTRRVITVHHKDYPNLDIFSMGSMPFVGEDSGTFWDKEMFRDHVLQSLIDVDWDIRYLIVDLPAGIDQSIAVFQEVLRKIHGVILVTQPSGVSANDVGKAITACKDLKIPIMGVIENMSEFKCPECGRVSHPLGKDGGYRLATKRGLPLLGNIPLLERASGAGDRKDPYFQDPRKTLDTTAELIYDTRLGFWRR